MTTTTDASTATISLIEPTRLTIEEKYDSGAVHHVHLEENHDLGIAVKRLAGHSSDCPGGIVLLLLDEDGGDHDVVLVQRGEIGGIEEALARANEAIRPARQAMQRVFSA